jgi:hypothetical protein
MIAVNEPVISRPPNITNQDGNIAGNRVELIDYGRDTGARKNFRKSTATRSPLVFLMYG